MMGVIFTHGFETQQSLAGVGLEFGRLVGDHCEIRETSSIVGSGRRYLHINSGASSFSADRGLGYELDFDGDEIWFGSYVQVLSNLRTRIFMVGAGVSKWLRLQVVVNPTDASSSIGFNHQPINNNSIDSTGTSMDVNSGPDWKFATEDNWDDENNAWRFVSVRIVRRDNDGDAFLYVDNFKRVELLNSAALGKHQGNITEISLAGFEKTNNTGKHVRHDDFWVSTTQLNEFRVFPTTVGELGSYDQAIPSIEDATPQDLISDYPSDLSTFLSMGEGDAISFKLDDSVIEDENATGVSDLKLELYVGGPAEYQVFVKDGASEESLGDFFVGGIAPEPIRIDLTENPITQAPWTREDLANIEIGVRNTMGGSGGGGAGGPLIESLDFDTDGTTGGQQESGYEFVPAADGQVVGARLWAPTAKSFIVNLWAVTGEEKLATLTMDSVDDAWSEVALFDTPVDVVGGEEYIISMGFPGASQPWKRALRETIVTTDAATLTASRTRTTANAFPTNRTVFTYVFGIPDVVLG